MLLPYTAGVYYGPAAIAMVVGDSIGDSESIHVKGDLKFSVSAQGTGAIEYMRLIRLRGFPLTALGTGEIHAIQPRMAARLGLDVKISELSQDDVVGALQTMPVTPEMSFAEFCLAMIAYMENGGSAPTAEQNAAAILAAAQITPIHADARSNNGALIIGDGSIADPWRGAGVVVP